MNDINVDKPLYLDACSTSPPLRSVIEEMSRAQLHYWGNPSSIHQIGIRSSEIIERSRIDISKTFNILPDQIVFTSGATESIKLAFYTISSHLKPGRIIVSAVEHPAVFDSAEWLSKLGWEICFWPVDKNGIIRLDCLDELLSPPTKIVSLIWGQSEIGSLQPINLIGHECKERDITFHIDGTQILPQGTFSCDKLNFDLISFSAHKFQGPMGIGMLIVSEDKIGLFMPKNTIDVNNNQFRRGTLSCPLISGMNIALKHIKGRVIVDNTNTTFNKNPVATITSQLRDQLASINGIVFTGHPTKRLPNHISMVISNSSLVPIQARSFVRHLSQRGIYVSSGTACNSGKLSDSKTLEAIKVKKSLRKSGIRVSLGPWITENDIDRIIKTFVDLLALS